MEKFSAQQPEQAVERYIERVGRMTLYRHGDTEYTNTYPDLTEEGKQKLLEAGQKLKGEVKEEEEDLLFLHSPSVRAKTSMAFLLHGMEKITGVKEVDVEKHARPFKPLRSVGFTDHTKAMELLERHLDPTLPKEQSFPEFDRLYAIHEDFETSPHWEPRSKVERRGMRLLRQAVYLLVKNHTEKTSDKTPHVIAISHFETLNKLAATIFNLDLKRDSLYARGESMTFDVKTDGEDEQKVLLEVEFRGERKKVWFIVETGEIIPL